MRTFFLILLTVLALAPRAHAQASQDSLSALEVAPLPGNTLLFSGLYQAKPVHLVRNGLSGKGSWHLYTGTPGNRVRVTMDDQSGLSEVLAMDAGYRVGVARVKDERVEYRFYTPQRRFMLGSVLFKKDGQWHQGLMRTESFQGYAALSEVAPVKEYALAEAKGRQGGLLVALRHAWANMHVIAPAHAQDNVIRGFLSDSAVDARAFFSDPGQEMLKASLVGAAAFAGKLAAQAAAHGELGAAVVAAGPFLGWVAVGVGVGLAASRVSDWMETKQLRGTASAGELLRRLTRDTPFTRAAAPVIPPPFAAPGTYATKPAPAPASASSRPGEQARRDERALTQRDAEQFRQELALIEACRSRGDAVCAQAHLTKAASLQGGYLDLKALDALRDALRQDKQRAAPAAGAAPAGDARAKTAGVAVKKSRGNDPALVGLFDSADAPPEQRSYVFGPSELTVTSERCAITYRYTTTAIGGVNYLSYTSVSDVPAGCSGPLGVEFARTYRVAGNGVQIESSTERPVSLLRR